MVAVPDHRYRADPRRSDRQTLKGARYKQYGQARRDRREGAGQGESREAGEQHGLAAVAIHQRPVDDRAQPNAQTVDHRHQLAVVGRADVEIVHDGRETGQHAVEAEGPEHHKRSHHRDEGGEKRHLVGLWRL